MARSCSRSAVRLLSSILLLSILTSDALGIALPNPAQRSEHSLTRRTVASVQQLKDLEDVAKNSLDLDVAPSTDKELSKTFFHALGDFLSQYDFFDFINYLLGYKRNGNTDGSGDATTSSTLPVVSASASASAGLDIDVDGGADSTTTVTRTSTRTTKITTRRSHSMTDLPAATDEPIFSILPFFPPSGSVSNATFPGLSPLTATEEPVAVVTTPVDIDTGFGIATAPVSASEPHLSILPWMGPSEHITDNVTEPTEPPLDVPEPTNVVTEPVSTLSLPTPTAILVANSSDPNEPVTLIFPVPTGTAPVSIPPFSLAGGPFGWNASFAGLASYAMTTATRPLILTNPLRPTDGPDFLSAADDLTTTTWINGTSTTTRTITVVPSPVATPDIGFIGAEGANGAGRGGIGSPQWVNTTVTIPLGGVTVTVTGVTGTGSVRPTGVLDPIDWPNITYIYPLESAIKAVATATGALPAVTGGLQADDAIGTPTWSNTTATRRVIFNTGAVSIVPTIILPDAPNATLSDLLPPGPKPPTLFSAAPDTDVITLIPPTTRPFPISLPSPTPASPPSTASPFLPIIPLPSLPSPPLNPFPTTSTTPTPFIFPPSALRTLRQICASPTIRTLTLPLLSSFYPNTTLTNGTSTPLLRPYPGCFLQDCSALGAEITRCQTLGKRVLLSVPLDPPAAVGGNLWYGSRTKPFFNASAPNWPALVNDSLLVRDRAPNLFDSRHMPAALATTLWNTFGEGEAADAIRPLGEGVVVDGFDVRVPKAWRGSFQGGMAEQFVKGLRALVNLSWKESGGIKASAADLGVDGKATVVFAWE